MSSTLYMLLLLLLLTLYLVAIKATIHPLPLVTQLGTPDFSVAYDISNIHILSFGVPIQDLNEVSRYYWPSVTFVDAPVDHMYLRDRFRVEHVPHVILINADQTQRNITQFHLDCRVGVWDIKRFIDRNWKDIHELNVESIYKRNCSGI